MRIVHNIMYMYQNNKCFLLLSTRTDVNVTFNSFNYKEPHIVYWIMSIMNDRAIDYFSVFEMYGRVKYMLSICDVVTRGYENQQAQTLVVFSRNRPLHAKYRTYRYTAKLRAISLLIIPDYYVSYQNCSFYQYGFNEHVDVFIWFRF